jgi:hypothetical protein
MAAFHAVLILMDGVVAEREHDALLLPRFAEKGGQAFGERDLPSFTASGLRPGDGGKISFPVDVILSLMQELTPPHAGVERANCDPPEMGGGGF